VVEEFIEFALAAPTIESLKATQQGRAATPI
jgi:hypothetical protein